MFITRCFSELKDKYVWARRRFWYYRNTRRKINNFSKPIPKLSSKEKKEIKNYWKQFGIKPDYNTFRWYYGVDNNKDPKYLSEYVYDKYVWRRFNNMVRCESLNDKNIFDLIFSGYNQAKTVVRKINGVLLDEKYQPITVDSAVSMCASYEKLAIKPSVDGYAGAGVKCIKGNEFKEALGDYKKDFIVQEVIKQHESFAQFNESSVNVVRVTTMLVEDKFYVADSIIRVGSADSFTDHKNVAIGIKENGEVKDYGVTISGEKVYKLGNGCVIKGKKLFAYDKMLSLAKEMHFKVAQAGIVGWDFTVDEKGEPLLIEANIWFPGVMRGQDCNGPIFAQNTEVIMKYLTK